MDSVGDKSIRAMYKDATRKVRLNGRESKAFSVKEIR